MSKKRECDVLAILGIFYLAVFILLPLIYCFNKQFPSGMFLVMELLSFLGALFCINNFCNAYKNQTK